MEKMVDASRLTGMSIDEGSRAMFESSQQNEHRILGRVTARLLLNVRVSSAAQHKRDTNSISEQRSSISRRPNASLHTGQLHSQIFIRAKLTAFCFHYSLRQ